MPDKSIIHIIDDDDAVRQSLEFLLKSAKLEVHTHKSATSFLEALPTFNPGCVITDVRMPGISGIELLKQLKSMASSIPVSTRTPMAG